MEEVTVSSKGQIVVPKVFRDGLGIKEGQKVVVEEVDGAIIIIPVPKDPIKALKGLAKGVFRKSSTELIRELRDEWQ